MAMTIRELATKYGLDVDYGSFRKGGQAAESSKEKLGKVARAAELAKGAFGGLAKGAAILATGLGIAGAAMLGLAKHAAATGAAIDDATKRAGVSAREYQRLGFALEQSGGTTEGLADSLKFLGKAVVDARTGTGPAADAFAKLGINLAALEGMGVEEKFGVIADAMKGIEDQALKSDIQMTLFGRGGMTLGPLFDEGAEGIKRMGDEAERLGTVMSDEAIAKAAELDDQLGALGRQFDSVLVELGGQVIPVVQEIGGQVSDWIAENRELIGQNLGEFFRDLVPLVKAGAVTVLELVEAVGKFVDMAGGAENALQLVAGGLVAIKLAGLGIPGAMASASIAIGLLASTAISELNGVNAELRRTESLLRAGRIALRQGEEGGKALEDLDKMSPQELARLSDEEYQRRVDAVERGINAAHSAAGKDGTAMVFELREKLGRRREIGERVVEAGEKAEANVRTRERRAAEFKAKRAEEKKLQSKPRKLGGGAGRRKKPADEKKPEDELSIDDMLARDFGGGIGSGGKVVNAERAQLGTTINRYDNTFAPKVDITIPVTQQPGEDAEGLARRIRDLAHEAIEREVLRPGYDRFSGIVGA